MHGAMNHIFCRLDVQLKRQHRSHVSRCVPLSQITLDMVQKGLEDLMSSCLSQLFSCLSDGDRELSCLVARFSSKTNLKHQLFETCFPGSWPGLFGNEAVPNSVLSPPVLKAFMHRKLLSFSLHAPAVLD